MTAPQPKRTYLDGPDTTVDPDILEDYRRNDLDTNEIATLLATSIQHWLCGPYDDRDQGYESILTDSVERAARYIATQPCQCPTPGIPQRHWLLCDRCMAIGCSYGEHRTNTCQTKEPNDG